MRTHPIFTADDELAAIARGMLDRTLPKAQWTHAAHFATTLWLLAERPARDVARDMPGAIRAYNVSVGGVNNETSGYHETITQASIRAARWHRERHPGVAPFKIANELLASPQGDPDWLLAYWCRASLFSPQARLAWCEPDIAPLPF